MRFFVRGKKPSIFSQTQKIVLTGADGEQYKKFGLDAIPYQVFTLKHNPEKIDPRYYKEMFSYCNLGFEDVIYIEQNMDAVTSARSIGIETYHWDPQTKPVKDLQYFLKDALGK